MNITRHFNKKILIAEVFYYLPGCPSNALSERLSVNVATIEERNIFQINERLQKLVPSSKLSKTPPE